jgi:hypothetical protein
MTTDGIGASVIFGHEQETEEDDDGGGARG